ncbi:DUF1491 family protein [Bauldia litoralis]|uniref:DUF1491 domain-containing protein n=1 Tax=Bauldia litoralis TaxID=665467 RepID=A0A1G6CEE5_9HYPH|nr:DUF1491 family protein [Bauldia litoralis]SDB31256.1 hypothetical protein SAMN02982931_02383 [Bauldia litoralis]
MRVTSSLWVGAYVRRCQVEGAFAVVARRGAEEAGAILVIVDRLDGFSDLYAPAPQSLFDDAHPADRRFQRVAESAPADEIQQAIDRQTRFDPDVWIVAVEDREGRPFLDLADED